MQAYLDTTPEKSKEPRRGAWAGGTPDPGPLAYLYVDFMEIGPVVYTGQGQRPIGWPDIAGWQDATGDTLSPWEANAVITLSADYLNQHHASYKQGALAPWSDHTRVDQSALIAARKRRSARG